MERKKILKKGYDSNYSNTLTERVKKIKNCPLVIGTVNVTLTIIFVDF